MTTPPSQPGSPEQPNQHRPEAPRPPEPPLGGLGSHVPDGTAPGDPASGAPAPGGWDPATPSAGAAAPGGWDPTMPASGGAAPGGPSFGAAPGAAPGGPAPGGWDPGNPAPGGWDPAAVPGVPHGGYAVPPQSTSQPGYDPLISPDYNGWFSRAVALVKAGWRPLATLQAIGIVAVMLVQVPFVLWTVSVTVDLAETVEDDPAATPELNFLFGLLGLTLIGAFITMLVTALVALASMRVGVAVAIGERPDVGAALRVAATRMFPLIGWQIVAGLIIAVGVCACVLPAVYLYAVFVTVPAVVAFERTNVISRCFQLFHSDLGAAVARIATIVGFTVAASVLAGIIDAIVSAVTGASATELGSSSEVVETGTLIGSTIVTTLISVLIGAAVAVFTSQLILTAYADLRARVEPVSTAMLAHEIGLQPPAPTAAGPAPTGW